MNASRRYVVFTNVVMVILSILVAVTLVLYLDVKNQRDDAVNQLNTVSSRELTRLAPTASSAPTPDVTPSGAEQHTQGTIESIIRVPTEVATPSPLFLAGGEYCLVDRTVVSPLETGGLSLRYESGAVEFVELGSDGSKSMVSFSTENIEEYEYNYYGEFEENQNGFFGWVNTAALSVCQ